MTNPDVSETVGLPTGFQTMSPAMADMRAYPAYLFEQVAPHFKDRVWEIGVGHGTYTVWLRDADKTVLASDIDQACLIDVKQRFEDDDKVHTAVVDLTDESTVKAQREFQANSILCLNVLEHIEDDMQALSWLRENVATDAVMGLIVPAHPQLFGRMDSEAGHFRRYTRRSLTDTCEQAGWRSRTDTILERAGSCGLVVPQSLAERCWTCRRFGERSNAIGRPLAAPRRTANRPADPMVCRTFGAGNRPRKISSHRLSPLAPLPSVRSRSH